MKTLKKILLVLTSIIVLVLIVALFVKKHYAVEREIIINQPKQKVFEYVKYLKNQDHFSKWAMMDPNMKKEYRGTDGTVGFVSAWESENGKVGKGEMEIKGITEGERLDLGLHFFKPFEALASAHMTTDSTGTNQTTVKWGMESSMKYPMNVMLLFHMENMIGNDLATGLSNLKSLMEK